MKRKLCTLSAAISLILNMAFLLVLKKVNSTDLEDVTLKGRDRESKALGVSNSASVSSKASISDIYSLLSADALSNEDKARSGFRIESELVAKTSTFFDNFGYMSSLGARAIGFEKSDQTIYNSIVDEMNNSIRLVEAAGAVRETDSNDGGTWILVPPHESETGAAIQSAINSLSQFSTPGQLEILRLAMSESSLVTRGNQLQRYSLAFDDSSAVIEIRSGDEKSLSNLPVLSPDEDLVDRGNVSMNSEAVMLFGHLMPVEEVTKQLFKDGN